MNFHEHKRETFSVCWNPVTKDTFVSSSWDGTVKIVCASPCSSRDFTTFQESIYRLPF